jgi:hypothetical protein
MRAHHEVMNQFRYGTPSGGYGGTTLGRTSFHAL